MACERVRVRAFVLFYHPREPSVVASESLAVFLQQLTEDILVSLAVADERAEVVPCLGRAGNASIQFGHT